MFILLALCCPAISAHSQDNPDRVDQIVNFPSSFFSKVNKKTASLEDRLIRQMEKYLQRLAKRDKKLQRKLAKIDSSAAQQLFSNSEEQYAQMINRMSQVSSPTGVPIAIGRVGAEYLPAMDSLKTSLSFLQQNNQLLANSKEIQQKAQSSLAGVNNLQNKLQQTEEVKAFIQQRKQQIKEGLSKYTSLPKGIINSVTNFNKEAYYYSAQIKEYKELLKDPDRMVEKGLSLLNKLPAFQQFMRQHSELASLFRLPDNYGTPQSLAGLQTRSQVQQQIQGQLAVAGPNAQQYLQQNIRAAQAQLNQLKDKINKLGGNGSSGDADLPNFKPNNQKTKTFWQRLEYGTNFQTAKANFFPTTTDLGLSVGYKLNNKSTIGVGASYKMGWGQDIKHIAITHQGMGLRSYLDIKLKGSFFGSGGFEYNYQPLAIEGVTPPPSGGGGVGAWSQSGLVGLSKVVSIKSKFFKKTRLQLLWDFLSYQQIPRTQPVKFRVGYNF